MNRSAIDKITPPCFISFIFVYNPSTAENIQWMERFQTALSKLKELYPIFEHDIPIETNNQSTTLLESGFDATNPANSFQNISKWPRYLTQDISHDKSIFSAKITTFTCGGVAVGFNFQHGVFDGAGACKILQNLSHFMDTGAWLDKGDDTMNRSEIFNNVMKMADSAKCNDGSYLAIPSSDLAKLQTEQSAEPIEGGLRLVRLKYEEIEKLREQMNSEEGRSVFSINDIVCSLLWFLFIQQHPLDELSWKYLLVLDSRRPLKNYLSETYTGNSAIVRQVAVNGSKSDIKLLDLCKATRKTITDSLDQKNLAETLLWFEKSLNDNKLVIQNFRLNPPSGFPDLLISNWYRFLYDISLGMGSPIYGGCPPFAPSMAGVGLLKPLPKTKDILLAMNMPDCVFGALSHSPIFHSSVTIE